MRQENKIPLYEELAGNLTLGGSLILWGPHIPSAGFFSFNKRYDDNNLKYKITFFTGPLE